MLANTPNNVDTYFLPNDALAAKARIIALIAAATTKIRIAMSALQDPDIITAIETAYTGGVTDVKIGIDWYTAHLQWEHQSIAVLRSIITPANVAYTIDPTTKGPTRQNLASIDDTTTLDGSAQWTVPTWSSISHVIEIRNATLATANRTAIDTLIAWNLTHTPQSP